MLYSLAHNFNWTFFKNVENICMLYNRPFHADWWLKCKFHQFAQKSWIYSWIMCSRLISYDEFICCGQVTEQNNNDPFLWCWQAARQRQNDFCNFWWNTDHVGQSGPDSWLMSFSASAHKTSSDTDLLSALTQNIIWYWSFISSNTKHHLILIFY